MPNADPYTTGPVLEYECADCGSRVRAERSPGPCPACGGVLLDVSVARE